MTGKSDWSFFSGFKPWKAYTFSYHDSVLRGMVKLVNMESKHENSYYGELFHTDKPNAAVTTQPFYSAMNTLIIRKENKHYWKKPF